MSEEVTYTFEPIAVEGGDPITPSEEQVTDLTEFAKANSMTQEQAQAFAARELTRQPEVVEKDPVAPESYEFKELKDDKGEVIDTKDITEEVAAFAKENGLTQKQAEAQFDRELKLREEADAAQKEAVKELQTEWRAQLSQDSEIGGENLEANVATAKKALETFFPGLKGTEDKHPFLDHPEVVKGLYKIGKAISEDGDFVPAGGAHHTADPNARAAKLFPSMNQA